MKSIIVILFLLIQVIHPFLVLSQFADHWETIIFSSDSWKYLPGTQAPPDGWNLPGFDDSGWLSGTGGIGYGDGDDSTVIEPVLSLYLRKEFTVIDTSVIIEAILHMDYDDAFVAYLNGNEIARANIGFPNVPPSWDEELPIDHEALLYQGIPPEGFSFEPAGLQDGNNILAIEVHNVGITSSDLSSGAWLSVGIRDTTFTYYPVPGWFNVVSKDFASELPLVMIDTKDQFIQDEDRITVNFRVIDNGPGKMNSPADTGSTFNGMASIEIRGESSAFFPKKSYSFELQDSAGEKLNFPLMGFPEENDWILHAHYTDKTCLRNVLTYKLAHDMGRYATRTKYCEVFLNNDYIGLYSLMEKIKQDKNRVNILKLRPEDISGDALTGGYILRVDKVDGNDYPPWVSVPNPHLPNEPDITFQYSDPDGFRLTSEQKNYIRNFIWRFESSLSSDDYLHPSRGYQNYINTESFVDFLLINEITKNIDGYLFSTFMYKERDSEGGKLFMGPVWDFDLGYANVDYEMNVINIPGWMYNDGWRMYWFRRMMTDPRFRNKLSCRWHSLRGNIFSDEHILGYIDSAASALREPLKRNFERWPVIGTYIWPNYFIGQTYNEELDYMKDWLYRRLHWMDENIPATCVTALNENIPDFNSINLYPNPFRKNLTFDFRHGAIFPVNVVIADRTGREVFVHEFSPGDHLSGIFQWDGCDAGHFPVPPGLYLVSIRSDAGIQGTYKIIKQ